MMVMVINAYVGILQEVTARGEMIMYYYCRQRQVLQQCF